MDSFENWLLPEENIEEETIASEKENSLTLAMELPAMDYKKMDFYENLSPQHKKEISLWVLMRFMSSSQSDPEHHLLMVNDLVNHNFNLISKHPNLQWKLLALCGTKRKQFHPWIAPGKGVKKNKLEEAILNFYPTFRDEELELFFQLNSDEELKQFFKDNGFDDKSIKELFSVQKEK
jgi:hypothetical protein